MRLWGRLRARQRELDERVAAAEELVAAAEAQAAHSEERREHIIVHTVTPMKRAAAHNQFMDMIRKSLANGPAAR